MNSIRFWTQWFWVTLAGALPGALIGWEWFATAGATVAFVGYFLAFLLRPR